MNEKIKLQFVELDEETHLPKKDEGGELIFIDDISEVNNAALVLPKGYVGMNYKGIDDIEIEDRIFDKLLLEFVYDTEICYCCNGFETRDVIFIFKMRNDIKINKNKFLTVGGFYATFFLPNDLVIVKSNKSNSVKYYVTDKINKELAEIPEEKLEQQKEELTLKKDKILKEKFMDIFKTKLSNCKKLPEICIPLLYCKENIDFSKTNVNTIKKKLKNFLKYILFEHSNYLYKINIINPDSKSDESADVNRLCYEGMKFIDSVFLKYSLDESDYWSLLTSVEKYGGKSLELINFDSIKEEKLDYLWYPYIPLGSVTLLVGDPGIGKSYLALKLASIISRGEHFPFDDNKSAYLEPSNIILQNGEDAKETTIKTRLIKMNADTSKIWFINDNNSNFKIDKIDVIERALYEKRPKLVIIDPITQYLPKISMDRANEVRNALSPLAELAAKYKTTFLLIAHKNKNVATKGLYRVMGSVDFVGICRSMLTASEIDGKLYLQQAKNSTASFGMPIEYEIDENGLEFIKQVENTKIDYSVDKPVEEAEKFILDELKDGEVPSKEIYKHANLNNIAKATLDRAKKRLGIGSRKRTAEDGSEYWVWLKKEEKEDN